jgi:outer membrane protein, heavy metal efflux system
VVARATEAANAAAQARAYGGEILQKSNEALRSIEAAWVTQSARLNDVFEANRLLFSTRLEQRRFIAMQLAALEDLHVLVPGTR